MLTISILLVALYVGAAIWNRKELPESVSSMVYDLPRSGRWLWIVWMWAVSLLMCIPLIDALPENVSGLGFLTLASLMLCGAMPISDSRVNRRAHNVFGILGGVLSQVCVAVVSPWWLAAWLLFVAIYGYDLLPSQNDRIYPSQWYDGKGVFLAEAICLLTVAGAVLTHLILQ